MKDLKNKAELLIKIGKERAEKKRQRTVIVRRSFASIAGLCAAVALGAAIWNNESIRNAADTDKFVPSGMLVQVNTAPTDTGIVTTAHNAGAVTTEAPHTTMIIAEVKTVTTTGVRAEAVLRTETPQPDIPVIDVPRSTAAPATTPRTTAIAMKPVTTTTAAAQGNQPTEIQDPAYCICSINGLNGNDYIGNNKVIRPENIGRLICGTEVNSEYYNSDIGRNERYSTISDVYALKDFSENYVVAVKDETEGKYYLLENQAYFPDTLGALFNDCGFDNSMEITLAEYYAQHKLTQYSDPDDKHIKKMLFSESSLLPEKALTDTGVEGMLTLYCDMPLIYDKPICMTVTVKGWLTVNLDENAIVFNIGEHKAEECIAFIVQEHFNEQLDETTAAPVGTAANPQI